YEEIIFNDTSRSICTASLLDNLPCDYCVYKPYCGVCPVVNYALNKDIFAFLPGNEKCELNKGILDYLFRKLEDKETRKVFKKWISFTGITGFPNITS
ncbi:MAG: His-Xaa-Ser system radical SAM maturase HxsB, partial [Candidatus Paceibacterota bacterium]